MVKMTYTNGNVVTDGYEFERILTPDVQKYPSVNNTPSMSDSEKKYDSITKLTIKMSDPKYNVELYSTAIVDENSLRLYTLTYDNNGGYDCYKELRKSGETWGPLCLPKTSQTGYSFWGWFNQPSGGYEITNSDIAEGNITVYAQWTNRRFTCAPGTYLKANTTTCSTCPTDHYCEGIENVLFDKVNNQGIENCIAGYHSVSGSSGVSSCKITCDNLTYLKNTNDSSCTACASGNVSISHQVIQGNTSSCTACGAGKYANGTICSNCPRGSYSTGSANTSCTNCPTGYNTDDTGKTAKADCKITCAANTRVASVDAQCTGCGTGYSIASHTVAAGNTSAVCTANTYTVTFDKRSGTGGSNSVTATYGSNMPSATMPTRSGYVFGGYFTETNGGGTQYYNADGTSTRTWNIASAKTLYAQWTACGAGNYVASNVCKPCPAGSYSTGTANASCTDCPTGYTTDGTGKTAKTACYTTCSNNQRVTAADAQCTACASGTVSSGGTVIAGNTLSCTSCGAGKYANGSTCSDCPTGSYSTGTANASCTNCPAGYNTDDTGKTAKADCKITCAANTRVASVDAQCTGCGTGYSIASHTVAAGNTSAACTANVYTITFDKNNGSGGTNSVNIAYGTAAGNYPSIVKPTRSGYKFDGYWSSKTGGTQWYDSNGNSLRQFDLTSNTTWYAQWKASCTSTAHTFNESTGKCEYSAVVTMYRCHTTAPKTQLYSYQSVICYKKPNGTYGTTGSIVEGATSCPSQLTICNASHVGTWREGNCVADGYSYGSCPGNGERHGDYCYVWTSSSNCPSPYGGASPSRWSCDSSSHGPDSNNMCSYTP